VRPPLLDDVSAAEGRRRAGTTSSGGSGSLDSRGRGQAGAIGHEMSRRYILEHPVDDPDDEDDDDFDEDEDGDEDEDDEGDDEEEVETWQVSNCTVPLKAVLSLTSATELT
jgi:hypothetical protein